MGLIIEPLKDIKVPLPASILHSTPQATHHQSLLHLATMKLTLSFVIAAVALVQVTAAVPVVDKRAMKPITGMSLCTCSIQPHFRVFCSLCYQHRS
ncbi:uncharacterized protein EDB91DRAFT_1348314 [Suillus paluster]|uniref:uncharacterized protein n=1 Tax=Suillus paluster TaxID=48578 RepID=UPI001B85BA78|nr:uncharacterized protein EDB91DRAFT_1348314 [Suillus paluster]KAG1735295.1 hypothetical protein EDB91DRAFT_1348314 [Suillus paluster]